MFWALFAQAAPVLKFDCSLYLKVAPRESIEKFLNTGYAIHETERNDQALSDAAAAELETSRLAYFISKNAETTLGRMRTDWLLRNPRLDSDEIREVQSAVQELHDSPELQKAIVQSLAAIRNFETRNNIGDRVNKWILKKFRSDRKLQQFMIAQRLQGFDSYGDNLEKAADFLHAYAMPAVGGALYWSKSLYMASMLQGISRSMNKMTRAKISNLELMTISYRSISKALLTYAKSPYLRELGTFLGSVDDKKSPLGAYPVVRKIESLANDPDVARALDATYLSNVILHQSKKTIRGGMHRLAVLTSAVAEVDALLGFSRLLDFSPGTPYAFRMPLVLDEAAPAQLSIYGGRHPLLTLWKPEAVVSNNVFLSTAANAKNMLFVTGLNANGKSTYTRMIALLMAMAQSGAPVPADDMRFTPMHILTVMRRADSTESGESTFRNEVRRVSQLVDTVQAHPRALVLLDELFSGTSHREAEASAEAVLRYLHDQNTLVVATSHNRELARLDQELPGFLNVHASDDDLRRFQIEPGPSTRHNAFDVMAEEGLPKQLIELARKFYRAKPQ